MTPSPKENKVSSLLPECHRREEKEIMFYPPPIKVPFSLFPFCNKADSLAQLIWGWAEGPQRSKKSKSFPFGRWRKTFSKHKVEFPNSLFVAENRHETPFFATSGQKNSPLISNPRKKIGFSSQEGKFVNWPFSSRLFLPAERKKSRFSVMKVVIPS